jgi:hypothetical protein
MADIIRSLRARPWLGPTPWLNPAGGTRSRCARNSARQAASNAWPLASAVMRLLATGHERRSERALGARTCGRRRRGSARLEHGSPGAVQLTAGVLSAGHRDQQAHRGTLDGGTLAVLPVEIGGLEVQVAHPLFASHEPAD